MAKKINKPLSEIAPEKVPVVAKKTTKKVPVKAVLKDAAKQVVRKTLTPKDESDKVLAKLGAHALKHLKNWHSKAGDKGPLFAKMLTKHAKELGKTQ